MMKDGLMLAWCWPWLALAASDINRKPLGGVCFVAFIRPQSRTSQDSQRAEIQAGRRELFGVVSSRLTVNCLMMLVAPSLIVSYFFFLLSSFFFLLSDFCCLLDDADIRQLLSQKVGTTRSSAAHHYALKTNRRLFEHLQRFTVPNLEEGILRLR